MRTEHRVRNSLVAGISLLALASPTSAQTIDSFAPERQRVGELVSIHGSGFSTVRGSVAFVQGLIEVPAPQVYLWRDDLIQVRVPVGYRDGGSMRQAIPSGELTLRVTGSGAAWVLNVGGFEVVRVPTALDLLRFKQLSQVINDRDEDSTLGNPVHNLARTKDAEVADVNNDGFPDLFDNNSNNQNNGTRRVLRMNNQRGGFRALPLFSDDNSVSYDTDMALLDHDLLPDLIHTRSEGGASDRVEIMLNGGAEPVFAIDSPDASIRLDFCPDDLDHGDFDLDGDVDVIVSQRVGRGPCIGDAGPSITSLIRNDLPADPTMPPTFVRAIDQSAPMGSTHDVFFLEADGDGELDVVTVNEDTTSRLYLQTAAGGLAETSLSSTFADVHPILAKAGAAGDVNGDGREDFVLAGGDEVVAYINRSTATAVDFDILPLGDAAGTYYDVELVDIDLDGDLDVFGVTLDDDSGDTLFLWRNNGAESPTFDRINTLGGQPAFPGHQAYQRLSIDTIDFDRDGDLDVYVTGADGQDVGDGGDNPLGRVPNQFFMNMTALNIVQPVTALPTDVRAQDTDPRILIRLAGPALDLVASDLQFEVGSDSFGAERVVTMGQVGGETWMIFRPGQQLVAGRQCFDLRVEMVAFPELFDFEEDAICYQEAAPLDRMIAIDRTTSMLFIDDVEDDEKMRAAVAAGEFFVDLSAEDDRLGALSFQAVGDTNSNGDVDILPEVVRVEGPSFAPLSAAQRLNLRTAVRNLWPTPVPPMFETSIGAPAQEALRILDDAPVVSPVTRHIVLITDGIENLDPRYEADVENEILGADPPVSIYALSVGADAEDELLQRIAERSGGFWANLLPGEGSFFLVSRLADLYKRIDADIRGEQRFFYREGLPPCVTPLDDRCILSGAFDVAPGLEWMTVGFHWDLPGSSFVPDLSSMLLLDPTGTPVLHGPPAVESYSEERHKTFRITQPDPGTWSYEIISPQVDSPVSDLEFFATASAPSILALSKGPVDVEFLAGGGIDAHLRLYLTDNAPILGADVSAVIRDPDGGKTNVTFFDDGLHEDGAAGDGLYGHVHTAFERGAYLVDAVATGESNTGAAFTRYAMCAFQYPDRDKPDGPEGSGFPVPGEGCGCLPRAEDWSFAAFAGATIPGDPFDNVADGATALGLQLARQFSGQISTGLFLGHDRFDNTVEGGDFSFTHLSAEFAYILSNELCPRPSLHVGVGLYQDRDDDIEDGYHVGASLGICFLRQQAMELRYDYRVIDSLDVKYSTLLFGLRWRF